MSALRIATIFSMEVFGRHVPTHNSYSHNNSTALSQTAASEFVSLALIVRQTWFGSLTAGSRRFTAIPRSAASAIQKQTGRRQTSVRRTHCSARSFLVPQVPRLVWQVNCKFWVLLPPWWSFLSVGGGYQAYISNQCAMLRSRMATGMSKHFSGGIGQSRPCTRLKVDDFVQSANHGALKD
ncbi:hypothetical protein PQQ86_09560 [Paraburkholderia sediminicola]|uniref:hypothetical protein n=1 Tax=Paraburkholderia sediminicola TaxID=458836 RepID=UPI0038B92A43